MKRGLECCGRLLCLAAQGLKALSLRGYYVCACEKERLLIHPPLMAVCVRENAREAEYTPTQRLVQRERRASVHIRGHHGTAPRGALRFGIALAPPLFVFMKRQGNYCINPETFFFTVPVWNQSYSRLQSASQQMFSCFRNAFRSESILCCPKRVRDTLSSA